MTHTHMSAMLHNIYHYTSESGPTVEISNSHRMHTTISNVKSEAGLRTLRHHKTRANLFYIVYCSIFSSFVKLAKTNLNR